MTRIILETNDRSKDMTAGDAEELLEVLERVASVIMSDEFYAGGITAPIEEFLEKVKPAYYWDETYSFFEHWVEE